MERRPHPTAIAVLTLSLLSLGSTASVAAPRLFDSRLTVRTVASGLNLPIGLAFIGENDAFVLEKNSGKVVRLVNGQVVSTVLDSLVVTRWPLRSRRGSVSSFS